MKELEEVRKLCSLKGRTRREGGGEEVADEDGGGIPVPARPVRGIDGYE